MLKELLTAILLGVSAGSWVVGYPAVSGAFAAVVVSLIFGKAKDANADI